MNRINRITLSLIAFAAAATMTTACSDPNDDEPTVYTDIVSFTSQTDKGSSFTLRKEGDSPLVTLTSATHASCSSIFPKAGTNTKADPYGSTPP